MTASRPVLPGHIAFKLWDTCGFPLDLTQQICRERGIDVDVHGFEELLAEQRQRSRRDRASLQARPIDVLDAGTVQRLTNLYDQLLASANAQQDIRPLLNDFTRAYNRASGREQGEFHARLSKTQGTRAP